MQTEHEPLPPAALPLYTVADAAKTLGVKPNYLYERIRDGRIATVNLGSEAKAKLRIRADHLQEFIDSITTPARAGGQAA